MEAVSLPRSRERGAALDAVAMRARSAAARLANVISRVLVARSRGSIVPGWISSVRLSVTQNSVPPSSRWSRLSEYVIVGAVRVVAAARRLVRSTTSGGPCRRGSSVLVGVQDGLVRGRLEGREELALVVGGVLEQRQRPRRARRDDDPVEPARLAVVGAELDAGVGAAHETARAGRAAPDRRAGRARAATYVRLPPVTVRQRVPAQPSIAWLPRKWISVLRREVERLHRRGRPERGGHRNEIMTPEAVRVPMRRERTRSNVRAASVSASAPCGGSGGSRAADRGPQRPGPRLDHVEPTAARDRERHLGLLRRNAELAEEPRQLRVVRLVVDDEPRVELVRTTLIVFTWPPGVPVRLEQLDLVGARKRVGCAQPGDTGANDRYLHRDVIRRTPPPWFGSSMTDVAIATVRERTSRASQVVTLLAVVIPPLGLLSPRSGCSGASRSRGSTSCCSSCSTCCSRARQTRSASTASSRTGASRRRRLVRGTFAILGSLTMQGPVTQWVTDHRKHHALSDQEGDPHSPHAGSRRRRLGAVKGFVARARGWLFTLKGMERGWHYGRDLYEDRLIRWHRPAVPRSGSSSRSACRSSSATSSAG